MKAINAWEKKRNKIHRAERMRKRKREKPFKRPLEWIAKLMASRIKLLRKRKKKGKRRKCFNFRFFFIDHRLTLHLLTPSKHFYKSFCCCFVEFAMKFGVNFTS